MSPQQGPGSITFSSNGIRFPRPVPFHEMINLWPIMAFRDRQPPSTHNPKVSRVLKLFLKSQSPTNSFQTILFLLGGKVVQTVAC